MPGRHAQQWAVRIEILKFEQQVFSSRGCPFVHEKEYHDAYIRLHYFAFVELYNNSGDHNELAECTAHLNVLLAFAANKNADVAKQFYTLGVMDLALRELNLEWCMTQMRGLKEPERKADVAAPSEHRHSRPATPEAAAAGGGAATAVAALPAQPAAERTPARPSFGLNLAGVAKVGEPVPKAVASPPASGSSSEDSADSDSDSEYDGRPMMAFKLDLRCAAPPVRASLPSAAAEASACVRWM
jgi:hypothetical protein